MTITFASLGVPEAQAQALAERGITEPFPIQAATIADGLAGRDVCGQAPTGSGKTIAFGIPLVTDLPRGAKAHPSALVLAPTRELATQITEELTMLVSASPKQDRVRILTVFGGVGYGGQKSGLARGVDILVACPGRLEDLIQQGCVKLSGVERVVIDEADRMADMGFLPAVTRILDKTHRDRQTLLFSATLDGPVDKLVRKYQHDPVRHDVAGQDLSGDIEHRVHRVSREDRVGHTADLVAQHGSSIVFCRTRRGADRVAKQLGSKGVQAVPIHGGRSQGQRERALEAFTNGNAQALVATDVAARGIHVDNVACVIHFDPAGEVDDYVHRSGRTGRAGNDGVVVSIVLDNEQEKDVAKLHRGAKVRAIGPVRMGSDRPRDIGDKVLAESGSEHRSAKKPRPSGGGGGGGGQRNGQSRNGSGGGGRGKRGGSASNGSGGGGQRRSGGGSSGQKRPQSVSSRRAG